MRHHAGLLAAALALHLAGCAGAPPAAPPADAAAPFTRLAAGFTTRALKQEGAGDARRALDSWKVVAALRPTAAEPQRRVADLTARLKAEADRHYRDGLARLREGDTDAARRELLLALVADPDHAAALEALKNRIEPDTIPYTVAPGDTFESIAKLQLGDPARAPLVARLNNADPGGIPIPGTVLSLPVLVQPGSLPGEKRAPAAAVDANGQQNTGYDVDPVDRETAAVPPAATSGATPAALTADELRKREKAEQLYNDGVRFFINQRLDAAIDSWEQTLSLYPQHPQAARDIEKARGLQQKLRDIR